MNADQVHVASYSPVQKCWHIESLADHVKSNARNLGADTLGDTAFCAVALAENREAARDTIAKIKGILSSEKEAGNDEGGA